MLFRRWRRTMACREAVGLVTDYLDDVLSDRDRVRFERHLADCPYCVEYVAQIRATVVAAGRVDPDELSPEAVDDLVGLYRAWRRD